MTALWTLFQPVALKVLGWMAIAGAVAAVLFNVKQAGRNAERVEGLKQQLDNVKVRNEVENEIDRLGDDAVRERLHRQWGRD